MDLTVISTYRCDSKCSMCHCWQYPTKSEEEISLDILKTLPGGFDNVNITGGEPTLRRDLAAMADILYPKARILEISSNGLHTKTLEPIIQKYPNLKIRYSLEGFENTTNRIRGEKDGFNRKVAGLMRLKELGGTDLGFGVVIQDENIDELVALYTFARSRGVELASSTLHNAFQFHKNDNHFYDRVKVATKIQGLIVEMLKTNSIKNWFRAYLNLGLMEKILGHERLIPCTAGKDFMFIDPWGDVYACNVRPDLYMGNLAKQSWDEILHSDKAGVLLEKARTCTQNCWMVTTARCAMRNQKIPSLPKWKPLAWVLKNKLNVMLGKSICFEKYIDFSQVEQEDPGQRRVSYLDKNVPAHIQHKEDVHYTHIGNYNNR